MQELAPRRDAEACAEAEENETGKAMGDGMKKNKSEGTAIYGASDDLIEFEGEYSGEVGYYGSGDEQDDHALVICSDGTVLEMDYAGTKDGAIWGITVKQKGTLFDRIEICTDENSDPYSDVVYLKPGIKWAYVAKGNWELAT